MRVELRPGEAERIRCQRPLAPAGQVGKGRGADWLRARPARVLGVSMKTRGLGIPTTVYHGGRPFVKGTLPW